MALVMGMPSAQEILRNVQDDLNESSGVYAILKSPPFVDFAEGGGGYNYWSELSICISGRVLGAIFWNEI